MVHLNETELIEYLLEVYGVFYSPTSVVIQLIMCFVAILFYVVFTITVSTTPFQLSCRVILLANSVASSVMITVHIIRSLVTVIELPTKFATDFSFNIYAGLGNNLLLLTTAAMAVYTFYDARRLYSVGKEHHTLETRYRMNTVSVLVCAALLMTRNRAMRKRLSILSHLKCLAPPVEFNTDTSTTTYFTMLEQHWK
ncbi:hypothetical protein PRIPAC_95488 [Pristionchus pacificus]|uniref:Uncharacterized protein n=1 Tax=Pristionchus pacificus TaxID=54126 RepID=A0A2A6BD23_PRIPA|nr:hypothetical protein PRIPAC_95488 [Pristionchus pacificus]|eukprot:PDM63731.1 hypothetical protein PRIPAC_49704 [Pristionchus pacificus]